MPIAASSYDIHSCIHGLRVLLSGSNVYHQCWQNNKFELSAFYDIFIMNSAEELKNELALNNQTAVLVFTMCSQQSL